MQAADVNEAAYIIEYIIWLVHIRLSQGCHNLVLSEQCRYNLVTRLVFLHNLAACMWHTCDKIVIPIWDTDHFFQSF